MSEEQLKAFQEKVKGDTSLQEKLKAAADTTDDRPHENLSAALKGMFS